MRGHLYLNYRGRSLFSISPLACTSTLRLGHLYLKNGYPYLKIQGNYD